MKVAYRQSWAQTRLGGGRTLLTIVALALGVWGLGSVLVAASILGPDMRQNFLGTAPPHAVIALPTADALSTVAWGTAQTEVRDLELLRIEVRPNEWIPLWLFGVQDFEHQELAKVARQEGKLAPSRGAIVIERDGRLVSSLTTGSVARVRAQGRVLSVPIEGVVFDPAQAPATQDHFIYAYTDEATWAQLTGRVTGTRVLVRFPEAHSAAEVRSAVAALNLPDAFTVTLPPFEEHPHQWQLDLLMGIIGSVGLLAFLLSAVLVSQVVAALLARQTRQIGVLKSLGASGGQITGIYGRYLFLLGTAGALVSLPLAVATGQGFAAFVAGILNFDVLTQQVPLPTLVVLVISALVLPYVFAAPTLLRAARIPVRQALADAGVPANPAAQRGWLALRNLARRPGRTILLVATTALGVALFATGFNVRESLAQFLGSTRDAMRFDLQVVLSTPVTREALSAPFASLSGIAATEFWTGGRGELQSRVARIDGLPGDQSLGVVALPIPTAMASPRMTQGRWLTTATAPEIVLNQESWLKLGHPAIGSQVTLSIGGQPRTLAVAGLAEEIDKAKIYLSQTLWTRWADPEAHANTLTLVARDRSYTGVMALKAELERAVAASDLPVLYVISQAERTKIIADHLDIILTVLVLLAFLVLWVASLGGAAAASITVMERTREIGVLRAIGASSGRIIGLFVAEGMTASGLGLVAGLVLAWPLSAAASVYFGALMLGEGAVLRQAWNPWGLVITAVVTLLFSWWASQTPARAATRTSTRSALAYE